MMRVALILSFSFLLCSLFVWLTASAFNRAQERQIQHRYIAAALDQTVERGRTVEWDEPLRPLSRPFSSYDAKLIGQALTEAWRTFALAQETGNADLIADWFSAIAEIRARSAVDDAENWGGRQIILAQKARPRFFHKDGSLFQAEVEMIVARYLSNDEEKLDAFFVKADKGIITMMHESNGWRLISYELRESDALSTQEVAWSGKLHGLNYYPAQTPWRAFWPNFDEDIIETDLNLIEGLGANAIRIFLNLEDFMGEDHQDALKNLERLLELADMRNMKVVPTLFDLKQNFGLGTWADDAVYLQRVLTILTGSDAVAFLDLKNEPDLDFEHHGRAKIIAWLKSMVALSRQHAPNLPITIGWSQAGFASVLAEELDLITYHDYEALETADQRLNSVQIIAKNKPVLITEIGYSAFEIGFAVPGSDHTQAKKLNSRLSALEKSDGIFIWTLHDFAKIDENAIGSSPWVRRLQASFGVYRLDRTEKPVAKTIRRHFANKN